MKLFPLLSVFLFLCVFSVELASATEQVSAEKTLSAQNQVFMIAPIEPELVEYPAQALRKWRTSGDQKPTLVLLSNRPMLQPVPESLSEFVKELITTAPEETLAEETSATNPDPLILPSMTLSAALQARLFSKVLWVFPSPNANQSLSLDIFRQQLLDLGAISSSEAATLTKTEHGFVGSIRGLPFLASPLSALPDLTEPVALHIDLDYFKPLYKGEIKTKLFKLLYSTLGALRNPAWPTTAVSISYSNSNGALPLTVRFIGPVLAELIAHPELLNQPLPSYWQQHSNALYLPNFIQTNNTQKLYLQMQAERPNDPAVKYALYKISRELKEGTKALSYLAEAVTLDKSYALEYLALAEEAAKKKLPEQLLRMLRLAHQAMPNDPFITLQLARAFIDQRQHEEAEALLKDLSVLTWSPIYYPTMPDLLQQLVNKIAEELKTTSS